jgi:hypothetical protein
MTTSPPPAFKFRDMLLSKFGKTTNTSQSEAVSEAAISKLPPAKSRLSFSVDSLLRKKFQPPPPEDDVMEDDDEDEVGDEEDSEEPEDLSSNNNVKIEVTQLPRLAMPTPLLPTSVAALAASMRPQPHFLAAGIAALAAAAAAANNHTSVTPSTTLTSTASSLPSNPFLTAASNGNGWPPGPPPGFSFGIPGLRHPLFNAGIYTSILSCQKRAVRIN